MHAGGKFLEGDPRKAQEAEGSGGGRLRRQKAQEAEGSGGRTAAGKRQKTIGMFRAERPLMHGIENGLQLHP